MQPRSLSENGPCLVDDSKPLETRSGTSGVYLPLIKQYDPISRRLGFGFVTTGGQNNIRDYPELDSLKAGWYLDWHARKYPPKPNGIEYVQMIHVHQKVECGSHVSDDRVACPYIVPYEYEVKPSLATIAEIAQINPGSTWLVGNEIERLDWGTDEGPGGQDEILPTLYPVAYHDIYNALKAADPTAQVAIGGVIQPTPLRLQYLSIVWETYQELYDETMPVDIWNTHNFIMQEKQGSWGANIPVGVPMPPNGEGMYIGLGQMWKHIDIEIFSQQIIDFRQWMKDRGQQEKPLIVTEYGVLYPNRFLDLSTRDRDSIQRFMLDTFDFFLNTKDCTIGYAADECRLVQRWNWYSLNDSTPEFTTYARLYDPETQEMTEIGRKFRDYSQDNIQQLSR